MKFSVDGLSSCKLFDGIAPDQLAALADCIGAARRTADKHETIFMAGDAVTTIGIVLSGAVHVVQEDFWGNRTILANIGPGDLFGEALCFAGLTQLPVSVRAVQPSQIMLIDGSRIITTCPAACDFHARLIRNLLTLLAEKNVMLTRKMEVLTRRTTREKLLAYLSAASRAAGSERFTIPFDRQALADYLAVDRSAMSSELSKMQREGILSYTRNAFELRSVG